MKKATGIIIYERTENSYKYCIRNFTMKTKNYFIDYTDVYNMDPQELTINGIVEKCLRIAKANNYYFEHYKQFNLTFYDIGWIDINNPGSIKKYGYRTV